MFTKYYFLRILQETHAVLSEQPHNFPSRSFFLLKEFFMSQKGNMVNATVFRKS